MNYPESHRFGRFLTLAGGPLHAVMGTLADFVSVLIELDVGSRFLYVLDLIMK